MLAGHCKIICSTIGIKNFLYACNRLRNERRMTLQEKNLILLDYLDYGIVKITLNSPPLNLNSLPFIQRLEEVVMQIENDDAVRVVILTGAGERAFSTGSDIKEFPNLSITFLRRSCAVKTPCIIALQKCLSR